ncbi:MAG: fibrobacter succinogenes major paralogous domain-containing protein [Sulfurovum sp.]|nr:fibrobacter succinogenes major paralogous domain-containing protein [Sulfurovum sp.]
MNFNSFSIIMIFVSLILVGCKSVCDANFSTTYNGNKYGCVINNTTHKVWLDRNLGATRVARSITDTLSYGDYFQWGRKADGHEDKTSKTTSVLATTLENPNSNFIVRAVDSDWVADGVDDNGSKRIDFLLKTDGKGICPNGFRVPTRQEWENEYHTWKSNDTEGAYTSVLKLPTSGIRVAEAQGARLTEMGERGYYWTSEFDETRRLARYFRTTSGKGVNFRPGFPIYGLSIRCIRKNSATAYEIAKNKYLE